MISIQHLILGCILFILGYIVNALRNWRKIKTVKESNKRLREALEFHKREAKKGRRLPSDYSGCYDEQVESGDIHGSD